MKPKPKPSTAQLIAALNRRITRMHEANVEHQTSANMDLGALTVNVNQLLELRRTQDVQMDRIIRILWKQQDERDRLLDQLDEANRFMGYPLRQDCEPGPKCVPRPDGSGYWPTAVPGASHALDGYWLNGKFVPR